MAARGASRRCTVPSGCTRSTRFRRDLRPEAVIDSLPGYAGSRPVRVGNAANAQVQLDVFGPVVQLISDLVHKRVANGLADALTDADWNLVSEMVFAVESRWAEPDHGIWEIRGAPRHHVYSKVMCWLTVDLALKLADRVRPASRHRDGRPCAMSSPSRCRNAAGTTSAVLHRGLRRHRPGRRTLHIGLSGLIEPSDPRFAATVVATEAELRSGATVYRYRSDDGLPGTEGGFHLCAAWLVEAYLLTDSGRRPRRCSIAWSPPRADRPALGGVRPGRRTGARQSSAGLQPPGAAALRPTARRLTPGSRPE